MKKYLFAASIVLLCACTASGPQKALDDLAKAMENNNGQAFISQFDMPVYAANYVKNMTQNDEALNSLNALGKMFGLGSIDDLIQNVVNMQSRLSDQYNRGVSSGELMAECKQATTPNCPWVPQSLRKATVVEINSTAAIAKVTTPANLTSWLALHKVGDKWLITGQAVLESHARAYATEVAPQTPRPAINQNATKI